MIRTTIVVLVALPALAACTSSLPAYDYSKEPDPRNMEYVLGVADGLIINVWKNPELSTQVTIRPDGVISIPLIGDLKAVGKTPSELKQTIREELARYVKLEGVVITIAVNKVASYQFTVTGEVNQPGIFHSAQYVTISEAVAMAGGLTRFADKDALLLLRRNRKNGELRRIPLAYSLIANGERPDMNLVIIPGDTLHVP